MTENLEDKIAAQIEYYFSDSNIPQDKHFSAISDGGSGWVRIEELATFKRIQELTTDTAVIAEALRQKSQEFLEVSEDGTKVKRLHPVPEDIMEQIMRRSLYVKGFPIDSTFEELKEYFSQHGKVLSLRMRRWKTKDFKGSLFVEFSTPEEADAVLAKADTLRPHRPRKYGLDQRGSKQRAVVGEKRKRTEGENDSATAEQEAKEEAAAAEKEQSGEMADEAPEKELQAPEKLEDQKLRIERKEDYIARKREEQKQGQHKRHREAPSAERTFQEDRLLKISGLPQEGVSSPETGKQEEEEGKDEGAAATSTEAIDLISAAGENEKEGEGEEDDGEKEKKKFDENQPSRESIRAFLEMEGFSVRYIDFERGKEVAIVRLKDPEHSPGAREAVEKLKDKELNGIIPKLEALRGEEEREYWETIWQKVKEMQQRSGRRRGGGRRGGRGRGRGRGRR